MQAINRYELTNAGKLLRESLDARARKPATIAARSARYGLGMSPAELDEFRTFDRIIRRGR